MRMMLSILAFAMLGTVGLLICDSRSVAWAEGSRSTPKSDFGPWGRAPSPWEYERPPDQYERLMRDLRELTLASERGLLSSPPEHKRRRALPRGDFWTPKDYKRAFPR
jgi:hypothetical protein